VTLKGLLHVPFDFLPLVPIAISVSGIAIASRVSRWRWLIHILSVIAMLLAPLLSIHLREIADPSLVEAPGPGDGLMLLFYLPVLAICLLAYGVAAVRLRFRR
jgi:hypothetical protein